MTLGIYGAGGLGREVFELANIINNRNNLWNEIVFIDDSENTSNPRNALILKFEEIKNKYGIDNFEVCIAVGEPAIRKILMEKLSSFNIKLKSLIHPDVYIPKSTKIGKGSIINKYVSITCDIIGDNVYIHPMACIGHDSIIGKNAIISSFVDVAEIVMLKRSFFSNWNNFETRYYNWKKVFWVWDLLFIEIFQVMSLQWVILPE